MTMKKNVAKLREYRSMDQLRILFCLLKFIQDSNKNMALKTHMALEMLDRLV
jgi:hypothetical protein